MSFRETIGQHLDAGAQALWITTFEEPRVLPEILTAVEAKRKTVYTWSSVKGLWKATPESEKVCNPDAGLKGALDSILSQGKGQAGVILLDPHEHFNASVNRQMREMLHERDNLTFVYVSTKDTVPYDLTHQVTKLRYQLPTEDEILKTAQEKRVASAKIMSEAAVGLTLDEAIVAMKLALLRHGSQEAKKAAHEVWKLKANQLANIGLVGIEQPTETWNDVGGLYLFKQWFDARASAFSNEAQKQGVPTPRGVILTGPYGTAKSLVGRVIANRLTEVSGRRWNHAEADFGRVMGPYVGETEEKTRQLFETLLSLRPIVVRIDEISHQTRGFESSGFTDSGVVSRMIHSFLTFLQERDPGVFIIGTTNEPWHMPPHMSRGGRFDAIFYFGLPRVDEMIEILQIHLKKHVGETKGFALKELATQMVDQKFSGAEAEQAIISARQTSYPKPMTPVALERAMTTISPAAIVMSKEFEKIDEWGRTRALPATAR